MAAAAAGKGPKWFLSRRTGLPGAVLSILQYGLDEKPMGPDALNAPSERCRSKVFLSARVFSMKRVSSVW